MKYSREDIDNILQEILSEIKNYKFNNKTKPNVIYLDSDLYTALALFKGFSIHLGMGTTEYLYGLQIYRTWGLRDKPFRLHYFKEDNNFQKIKSCNTKQEMADILSKFYSHYTKDDILIWLNSEN